MWGIEISRAAAAAELVLLIVIFGVLAIAAVEMWLEDTPERDEDEELGVTRWLV